MRHDREYRILPRSPSLTHFEFWKYLRPCQNSCSLVVRLRSVFLAAYTSNRALQHSGFEDFRYKMQTCMHGPCHHCLPAAPWGRNQTVFNIAIHVRLHSGIMMSKTFAYHFGMFSFRAMGHGQRGLLLWRLPPSSSSLPP